MLCYGGGNDGQGCCFIEGAVCPLRWALVGGHIIDAAGADLGTVTAYIASIITSTAGRKRATDQITGVKFVCRAAIAVVAANASLLTNRAGFETAWMGNAEYVSLVAPAWRTIEQREGLPVGTMDCARWKGTGRSQCCFADDPTLNATGASLLTTAARTLRQAGGS